MTKYKLSAIGDITSVLALGKTFCTVMGGSMVYNPLFEFPDNCVIVPIGDGEACISCEVLSKYTDKTLEILESIFKEKIFEVPEIKTAKLYKKTV